MTPCPRIPIYKLLKSYVKIWIFGKLFCLNKILECVLMFFLLFGLNGNEYLSIKDVSSVADPLIVCATTLLKCHAQDPKSIGSLFILRLASTTLMLCINLINVRLAPTV